jgi:hypothetical protein
VRHGRETTFAVLGLSLIVTGAALWWASVEWPWEADVRRNYGEFHLRISSASGAFDIGEGHHFEHWPVPYWKLVALGALVLSQTAILRRRRRRFEMVGFCTACGYDLRATPERCPECGRSVPSIALWSRPLLE